MFERLDIVELADEVATLSTMAVLLQRIAFQTRLRANRFIKLTLFITAWALDKMNDLIVEEYGDIRRTRKEHNILSSGYYLVCRKR